MLAAALVGTACWLHTHPGGRVGAIALAATGVAAVGGLQGSGFVEPRYLVARSDGQLLHVSRLLFLVASALRESLPPPAPRSR